MILKIVWIYTFISYKHQILNLIKLSLDLIFKPACNRVYQFLLVCFNIILLLNMLLRNLLGCIKFIYLDQLKYLMFKN